MRYVKSNANCVSVRSATVQPLQTDRVLNLAKGFCLFGGTAENGIFPRCMRRGLVKGISDTGKTVAKRDEVH